MRVTFVGSTTLPLKEYAGAILGEIARLPEGTSVLLRRGLKTDPGQFEQLVAQICEQLAIDVEWMLPEPNGGRAAVFERDIAMAEKSDEVVAFFPPNAVMEGGTAHVVEKAIDADRLTNVYVVLDGEKRWVAGHQPELLTASQR